MKIFALCVMPVLLLAWYALGFLALRQARVLTKSWRDIVLCTLGGFGMLGMVIAGLGFLQLWYKPVIILMVTVSVLVGFLGAYQHGFRVIISASRQFSIRSWPALCALAFLLVYVVCAFLPPTGIDELMYHLSVPRLYLEHHGFYAIAFNHQANLPMLAEMNYALGAVFGNHILCRLIAWCASMLCIAMIVVIARTVIDKKSYLWLVALLFLSHTNTIANFNECNVDCINAAFILATFFFISRWKSTPSWAGAAMTALMLGFAVQSKAFGVLALPVALMAMLLPFRKIGRAEIFQIVLMMVVPVACGLIWYAKSYFYQGEAIVGMNTIALAGTPTGTAALIAPIDRMTGFVRLLASNVASAPWSYSLLPERHRVDSFGPLFIAILPFIVLVKSKRPIMAILSFGAALWLMFIVLSSFRGMHGGLSIRYLTATIAFFSIAAVYVVSQTDSIALRRLLVLSIIVSAGLNGLMMVKRYRAEIGSVVTGESWQGYLMKHYAPYPAIDYLNAQKSSAERVAVPFCFGTYYLNSPYEVLGRHYIDSKELIDDCKQRGITWLLSNDVLDTAANRTAFFNGQNLTLMFDEKTFRVYRIPD